MLIKSHTIFTLILLLSVLSGLPGVAWNTFLGGTGSDESSGIAVDGNGNSYVVGFSEFAWGTPLSAHSGGYDAYVTKISSNGIREWHTFIGGAEWDFGEGVVLDSNGNLYVTGVSTGNWGTPILDFMGGEDAFIAKLNNAGLVEWNTFLGGVGLEQGHGIALDTDGNIYVVGVSGEWGTPLNPHAGSSKDAFVAKLNNDGVLQWHTFLGGSDLDDGFAIDVSPGGDIFVTGESYSTWGIPINAYNSSYDAFVAKLNTDGILQWNTFMGGTAVDRGSGIVLDGNEKVYVSGFSWASWGTPATPFAGGVADAFVAKLDGNGNFQWNTFLGGVQADSSRDIAKDSKGNIYVTGYSKATWGAPLNTFAGNDDAFVVKLNGNGIRLQNTFLGGYGAEDAFGVSVTGTKTYVTGSSTISWGNPLTAYTNGSDTFVTEIIVDASIFNDVNTSHWANYYVERLYNEGVTGGCTVNPPNYCPENKVSRAQMAVFLLKGIHDSLYTPPSVGSSTDFEDIPISYWAAAWIKQLAAEGITGGCGNGNYCPNNPVTRAQMAVFLLKSKYGVSYIPPDVGLSTGFNDVPVTHWAAAWIKQLAAENITSGCGNGNYCPNNPVTRAQMAVFLVKNFELP